ncbi:MAG: flagellar hook-length control protein FliK [Planctomycetota bacterium]|nr:MAG: flagellar hook-length control protein FliK [Planctomycetota bacterium]
MPTGLPTLASAPDTRSLEVRAKATPPASRSGPSFSRTLSEKRSDLGVDASAEADLQPDTQSVAAAGTVTPETSSQGGADQPRHTASGADGTAQGKPDDAQDLPNGPRLSGGVGSETLQPLVNAGTAPAPVAPVESSTTQQSRQTPQQPQQPQQQAISNHSASPSPGAVASAAVGQGSVVQQAVLTQGEANQLQPLQPEPTPGPGPTANGTQQQSTSSGADTPSGDNDRQPGAQHPAIGRALQVQAAVAVQNVAGHPVLGGPQATLAAPGLSEQSVLQTVTGLDTEEPATTSRVVRGLTAMLAQRGGSMTMRLDPPALGHLRVQMTIAGGTVTADFQPGTAEAQALLDRSIGTLRAALESQGLTVERLTVHAAPGSSATRETTDDQSQQQNQASRNQSDAGDGRSRGRNDDPSRQETPNHRFAEHFTEAFETHAATANDDLSDQTGAQAA